MINRPNINSILLISPSNLGDIVLSTPVFWRLHEEFPAGQIDVVTSPVGKEIFEKIPYVRETIIYRKHSGLAALLKHVTYLKKKRYDLVIDLKNTLIPFFIGAKYRSPMFLNVGARHACLPACLADRQARQAVPLHKRDEHLAKLASMGIRTAGSCFPSFSSASDRAKAEEILSRYPGKRAILVSPGSKSHLKRWSSEKFASLCRQLADDPANKIFLTGSDDDASLVAALSASLGGKAENVCSKTNAGALFELMKRAALVITNDSAPLHIASAANVPTVAIFGPSDERKYGPLAAKNAVASPSIKCRPCGRALCAIGPAEGCIAQVTVEEVFTAAKRLLA